MRRHRHQRAKHQAIAQWPEGLPPPGDVAARVRYIGSAEHKAYPSAAGAPALRTDATPCDPRYSDFEPITSALRAAVRGQCVGAEFIGDFPKYVWGWFDGRLYEARHVNAGTYKGYEIERVESPRDPQGLLERESNDA